MNKLNTSSKPKLSYKEFLIPKKNKKFRKICSPSKELLKYQQSKLKDLYKIYFGLVQNTSIYDTAHGFLPDRNVVTGANKHIGFENTIMMDISDFFDSVNKDMFYKYNNTLLLDDLFYHKEGYCSQGFATSPMLANIAIIDTLKEIDNRLMDMYIDKKNYAFTIYADDIQISTNINTKQNIKNIVNTIKDILEKHNFKLNERKTRVKFAKYGYRRILGVNVGEDHIRATRKTMRKIRAAKHNNNKNSLGGLVNWSKCKTPRKYENLNDLSKV